MNELDNKTKEELKKEKERLAKELKKKEQDRQRRKKRIKKGGKKKMGKEGEEKEGLNRIVEKIENSFKPMGEGLKKIAEGIGVLKADVDERKVKEAKKKEGLKKIQEIDVVVKETQEKDRKELIKVCELNPEDPRCKTLPGIIEAITEKVKAKVAPKKTEEKMPEEKKEEKKVVYSAKELLKPENEAALRTIVSKNPELMKEIRGEGIRLGLTESVDQPIAAKIMQEVVEKNKEKAKDFFKIVCQDDKCRVLIGESLKEAEKPKAELKKEATKEGKPKEETPKVEEKKKELKKPEEKKEEKKESKGFF